MKYRITALSLTLTFIVSFVATNAFAAEQYHATITGYAPYHYSVTDDDAIAQQLSGIESSIASTLSHSKGDVILTIDVYGNADETGLAKDNQDYGTKRAVEVQNALESKFQSFPGVTVHSYHFTNGTQQKTRRSTDVTWTVATAPAPAPLWENRAHDMTAIVLVIFACCTAIVIIGIMAKPNKGTATVTPKPAAEIVEFVWNGKTYTTIAEWKSDGKLHTKVPLPSDPNALLIRDDLRGVIYSLRGLAKKASYQPTIERLIAERIVIPKEVL